MSLIDKVQTARRSREPKAEGCGCHLEALGKDRRSGPWDPISGTHVQLGQLWCQLLALPAANSESLFLIGKSMILHTQYTL